MQGLAGTGTLLWLALRRDRIIAPIWILALTAFALSQAIGTIALYPTEADLARLAATTQGAGSNPAVVALTGPPFDVSTYGGATAWQVVVWQAALIGLMSLLLMVRHTRAEEEEAGRAELVGSGVVGRYAWLAAGLLAVLAANAALAVLSIAGYAAVGLPLAGSLALAAGPGLAGFTFAAVAAVTAQLSERARLASGLAAALLGLAFLLRAAGDAATAAPGGPDLEWLVWLSPIGWAEQLRPFAGERWWTLLLPLALSAALVALAAWFVRLRDVGAGMLASRPGPATAPAWLGTPAGLTWRLQRGALLGWTAGMAITGFTFGILAQDMGEFAAGDPQTARAFEQLGGGGAIIDAYLAAVFSLTGIVVAGYAVQAVLRLRAEESAYRAELVLATAVPRARWAACHLLGAAAGTAVVLAAAGLAGGLAHGLRAGDLAGELPRLLGAALVQAPAVWVLAGLAAALFGLAPRLVAASWAAVALALLVGQFGRVLQLDQWMKDLSPFTHIPRLPGGEVTAAPLLWLAALALALGLAGVAGFRRRDVG